MIVDVLPMAYRLSKIFAGSMTGSSTLFAFFCSGSQKNFHASSHSVPAALRAASMCIFTCGESVCCARQGEAARAINREKSGTTLLDIGIPPIRLAAQFKQFHGVEAADLHAIGFA